MTGDTNLEEYKYPEIYDLENPDFEPEGPFYLSTAKETGGPVLELGCGTGRYSTTIYISKRNGRGAGEGRI